MTRGRCERPVLEMRFEAGHAVGTDQRVVGRPGQELESIAGGEVDRAAVETEPDAPGGHHDDLVVTVVVRRVTISRSVRPGAGLETFLDEAPPKGARVGHGRGMVPAVGSERRRAQRRRAVAIDPGTRIMANALADPASWSPRLGPMRDPILYLSAADVIAAMPPVAERLELAERTMTALVDDAELPPKIGVHPRPTGSFAHAMPAALRPAAAPGGAFDIGSDLLGIKWVAGFPENRVAGLPAIHAVVILSDPGTGEPRAILDGGPITAHRTAAVSGVAIARFGPRAAAVAGAEDHPSRATIIGGGVQGNSHLDVLGHVLPGVAVTIVDRHHERAEALAETARSTPGIATARSMPIEHVRDATGAADVVITAASFTEPARRQVMDGGWLAPDALVVPVDYATMCAASVARDAALFLVDDRGQFLANREAGQFDDYPDPTGTLGEAILDGTIRPSSGRVVVTHLGVGLADVVFADAIVRRAEAAGLGTRLHR
jgi:alanine dehydrogenase